MIRLNDISLPLEYDENTLRAAAAKKLRVSSGDIACISLYKRSIDARKKDSIHFLAALDIKLRSNEKRAAA